MAGKREVSRSARVSASSLRISEPPAVAARMASRPVPADGSSTRSVGVIAAAVSAARPSGSGVENCWSAWASSERRVCVGNRRGDFRQHGKPRCRRRGFAEKRLSVFAQEQDARGLARLVGVFPVPGARRVGGAEGGFHSVAQGAGVDLLAAFEIGKQERAAKPAAVAEIADGRGERKRRGRERRPRKTGCSWDRPRRAGRDKPARRSLDRPGLHPVPALPQLYAGLYIRLEFL